jgi:hypothetical protein
MKRLRYTCRTKAGQVSLIQEGPDGLWRLSFGNAKDGAYGTPEGAVFAMANRTARMPQGLSADDWQGPAELREWKLEIAEDDVPPGGPSLEA